MCGRGGEERLWKSGDERRGEERREGRMSEGAPL